MKIIESACKWNESECMNQMKEMHIEIEKTLKNDVNQFNKLFELGPEKARVLRIIGSVVRSKQMIGQKPCEPVTGKIVCPDMKVMATKTFQEL